MTEPLFHLVPPEPASPDAPLSADRRRTIRQRTALDNGRHPLGLALGWPLRLHPQAPTGGDRIAPGPRCGNCRFRQVLPYHSRSYPKCIHPGTLGANEYQVDNRPRVTHGAGTDVRAWWPACTDHEWGDPSVPDGMRWLPATEPT